MQVVQLALGLLSLGEDELAASSVPKLYHLSLLWDDMICSRLNSRATQSASETAECQRFGECIYVVSPKQGHLATRIDGLTVYFIRREH